MKKLLLINPALVGSVSANGQHGAVTADNIWSNVVTSIQIRMLPSWCETRAECFCYLLILLILLYFYNRYRIEKSLLEFEAGLSLIAADKEKKLNERNLSFFTDISHELRTPLTLIINPVRELLAGRETKTADLNDLDVVYRNARRLLSLVDQLLLYQKAASGADELKVVSLDIVGLVREVFLCFNHQAKEKKITFEFVTVSAALLICADREKIEIALFNLISNALKFTPVGGSIAVMLSETLTHVEISIKDSGCGIPSCAGSQIYNRFYQVPGQAVPAAGFGIGLFLTRQFIEAHHGNLSYQSNPGQGTTFRVSLLRAGKDQHTPSVFKDSGKPSVLLDELLQEANQRLLKPELRKPVMIKTRDLLNMDLKYMVIVDDNAEIRTYLRQIFAGDFEIAEAANGWDGLKMIHQVLPDIVISDVLMQGLSGIELCSKVKGDNAINHIPIILLTASSSPENRLKGIEGGADDYISKPFEKELLKARVEAILKSRNNLQKYFFNEITLKSCDLKISADYRTFLSDCIRIVEKHFAMPDFCIKTLSDKMGMSHSNLYKKVRAISGVSVSAFIRYIRLRKAAEMFLSSDCTVSEAAYKVGINDPKYFREQFHKLFGLNPSEYIKRYRQSLQLNPELNAARLDIEKSEVTNILP